MTLENKYSVYVDDNRVNETLLTSIEAEDLLVKYRLAGVNEVFIVNEVDPTDGYEEE